MSEKLVGGKAAFFVLLDECAKSDQPTLRRYEIERLIDANARRVATAEYDLPIWKQQQAWANEYLANLKAKEKPCQKK